MESDFNRIETDYNVMVWISPFLFSLSILTEISCVAFNRTNYHDFVEWTKKCSHKKTELYFFFFNLFFDQPKNP